MMAYRKRKRLLVLAMTSAMAMIAVNGAAQTLPAGNQPSALGATGSADRLSIISRLGLNDPALKLTTAQGAQIDNLVIAHLTQQQTLTRSHPVTQGERPGQEAISARHAAFDELNAAVSKVLNAEQRGTWEAAQAQRQARTDAAITRGRQSTGNR